MGDYFLKLIIAGEKIWKENLRNFLTFEFDIWLQIKNRVRRDKNVINLLLFEYLKRYKNVTD